MISSHYLFHFKIQRKLQFVHYSSLWTRTTTEHLIKITKGFHILLGLSTLATVENYTWSFKNNQFHPLFLNRNSRVMLSHLYFWNTLHRILVPARVKNYNSEHRRCNGNASQVAARTISKVKSQMRGVGREHGMLSWCNEKNEWMK